MKEEKLRIIINVKNFLFELDDILCRFPNKEKVLKDRLKSTMYDILELIYLTNYSSMDNERLNIQSRILSKISLIDFILEESYKKGYIAELTFKEKVEFLKKLNVMIKSWIGYGKSNSKRDS